MRKGFLYFSYYLILITPFVFFLLRLLYPVPERRGCSDAAVWHLAVEEHCFQELKGMRYAMRV